jgi:hypothetical protein
MRPITKKDQKVRSIRKVSFFMATCCSYFRCALLFLVYQSSESHNQSIQMSILNPQASHYTYVVCLNRSGLVTFDSTLFRCLGVFGGRFGVPGVRQHGQIIMGPTRHAVPYLVPEKPAMTAKKFKTQNSVAENWFFFLFLLFWRQITVRP